MLIEARRANGPATFTLPLPDKTGYCALFFRGGLGGVHKIYYQTLDGVDRKLSKITSIVVFEVMSLAPLAFNNVKFHFFNKSFMVIFVCQKF